DSAKLIIDSLESILCTIADNPSATVGEVIAISEKIRALVKRDLDDAAAPENRLCDLFAQAVGADKVTGGEDFFALGGDSVKALHLVGRIRAELTAPMDV